MSRAMSATTILLLAVGLAMDATAVAAARGLAATRLRVRDVVFVATVFGGFQALMPAVGWVLGAQLGRLVAAWDHWIAFALLGAIGANMLREAMKSPARDDVDSRAPFEPVAILALGVATSIDALAAGVSLPMLHAPFVPTIATIGAVTALLSAVGLYAGRHLGGALGRRLDAVGGLVLIGIGTKILVAHLTQ